MSASKSNDPYMECTHTCTACAVCKDLDGHPGYDEGAEDLTLEELHPTQKEKIYVPPPKNPGWFGSAYWTGWEIFIVILWAWAMAGLLFHNQYGLLAQWCQLGFGRGNIQCAEKYGIRPYSGPGTPGYMYQAYNQPYNYLG